MKIGKIIREAIAIKDGYMESGRRFCKKGEIYTYREKENNKHPILMATDQALNHRMGWKFFNEYFKKKEFLEEEEFEL